MSEDKQDQFNQHQEVSPRTGETNSDGLSTNHTEENPTDKGSAGSMKSPRRYGSEPYPPEKSLPTGEIPQGRWSENR